MINDTTFYLNSKMRYNKTKRPHQSELSLPYSASEMRAMRVKGVMVSSMVEKLMARLRIDKQHSL